MVKRSRQSSAAAGSGVRRAAGSRGLARAAAKPKISRDGVTFGLEPVLWAALVGFALALRFASLDHLPLTTAESARAFNAWLVSQGNVPDSWSGDVTAALTSYLFRIFGSGETIARFIPAVSGSALLVSLWFARRHFGRGTVLLAATLLAFSPLAVHTSRSASSFALGGLLSMVMVLSLLAYVEKPRPLPIAILSAAAGLSLASGPIATSTLFALVAFVALEATWRREGAVSSSIATFRRTRDHWQLAALALAFTLSLGILQVGTDIDRLSLAGVRQWVDMFALPGDDLPRFYQLSVLAGYEWPLLLGGAAAYIVLVRRWITASRAPSLVQRLLLTWATVALFVVAFATQRDSGQLLLLLLPLSLLAARLLEEAVSSVDWGLIKRWWPAIGLALALLAYALLQLSRWAQEGSPISGTERALAVLALVATATIVAGGFYYWGRNGLILALPVGAALALPFLIHSSLSLGFGDGSEFAVDRRFTPGVELLSDIVALEAEQRGSTVAVEHPARDAIAWHLRDSGVVLEDPPAGSLIVTEAGREAPPGFNPLGGSWRITEGWIPPNFDLIPAWRWLVEREQYGNLSTIEVQILVPTE